MFLIWFMIVWWNCVSLFAGVSALICNYLLFSCCKTMARSSTILATGSWLCGACVLVSIFCASLRWALRSIRNIATFQFLSPNRYSYGTVSDANTALLAVCIILNKDYWYWFRLKWQQMNYTYLCHHLASEGIVSLEMILCVCPPSCLYHV